MSFVFQSWSGPEKLLALDELIDSCEPTQVKHMMQVIEPQFQRDFISLLPKEVKVQQLVTISTHSYSLYPALQKLTRFSNLTAMADHFAG